MSRLSPVLSISYEKSSIKTRHPGHRRTKSLHECNPCAGQVAGGGPTSIKPSGPFLERVCVFRFRRPTVKQDITCTTSGCSSRARWSPPRHRRLETRSNPTNKNSRKPSRAAVWMVAGVGRRHRSTPLSLWQTARHRTSLAQCFPPPTFR